MNVCVVASKVLAAPEEQDNATTGTKETWTTSHHPENQTPSSCTELTGTSTSDKSSQTSEFNYLFKESKMQSFTEEYFSNCHDSDDKVRFYTGLPSFDTLNTVFNFVEAHVSRRTKTLTPFQEFVMVLMKLRLNVPQQDLAYRFDVSQPTVSRIFWSWMIVMDARLSPLLKWPEREEIIRTMPACFEYSFGSKVTVIIDCFEVFIERPSNLLARGQTFSNYKHHNTVKVLIAITPQGSICFVSRAWGDVHLTSTLQQTAVCWKDWNLVT